MEIYFLRLMKRFKCLYNKCSNRIFWFVVSFLYFFASQSTQKTHIARLWIACGQAASKNCIYSPTTTTNTTKNDDGEKKVKKGKKKKKASSLPSADCAFWTPARTNHSHCYTITPWHHVAKVKECHAGGVAGGWAWQWAGFDGRQIGSECNCTPAMGNVHPAIDSTIQPGSQPTNQQLDFRKLGKCKLIEVN